eukprot:5846945-Prymnesium_polylepis.2
MKSMLAGHQAAILGLMTRGQSSSSSSLELAGLLPLAAADARWMMWPRWMPIRMQAFDLQYRGPPDWPLQADAKSFVQLPSASPVPTQVPPVGCWRGGICARGSQARGK